MSLLTRIASLTGSQPMLSAAIAALRPLEMPVSHGGLVARFRGHAFFEEYPTRPPPLALNGFMFTLLGLYDLSRAAPRTDALRLFNEGMTTLTWALPLYDTPSGFSIYDLAYLTQPGDPVHHSRFYHGVHILLLRALGHVARAAILRRFADRWNQYAPRPGDPA